MELPMVSCICPTFNRVDKLEEMLECFLRQDYKGKKELVILNDCPEQKLMYEHPEVRVINTNIQYSSLSRKHRDLVALTTGDYISVWDDDDIKMPNAISYCIERMLPRDLELFYPDKTLTAYGDTINRLVPSEHFHLYGMWKRTLYDRVGGYGEDVEFADANLQKKFLDELMNFRPYAIPYEELYALYRINIRLKQISFMNNTHPSDSEDSINYRKTVMDAALAIGEYTLKPGWKADYASLVKKALESGKLTRPIYYVMYNYDENKVTIHAGICNAYVKFLNQENGRCDYSFAIERHEDNINSNWGQCNKLPEADHRIEITLNGDLRYAYSSSPADKGRGTFEIKPLPVSPALRRNDNFLDLTDKICAEVGVWRGEFAQYINDCNPRELHLIDYWNYQPKEIYNETYNLSEPDQDANYECTRNRFKGCGNVRLVRKLSVDASLDYADGYFDFVYIDANHSFTACHEDMVAWWPKVRAGGYLCGHDWSWASVRRAVLKFCEEHNQGQIEPCVELMELTRDSWGIRRPI